MNIYSFEGSQWANVVHLGIAYKKIPQDQYVINEIDLGTAANFNPKYLQINHNATVPSLTSPSLSHPLTDSVAILNYLDGQYPPVHQLQPSSDDERQAVSQIVNLVHSERMSTNIILLQARSTSEMEGRRREWKQFVVNRQNKLLEYRQKYPNNPFYADKLEQETNLYKVYTRDNMNEAVFSTFFEESDEAYKAFAADVDELNRLLVLPYAAGEKETEADFHIIPWLAHPMWDSKGSDVHDFAPLEARIQQSVPKFVFGPRIKEWWSHVSQCSWFKEVFPNLH